MGQKPYVFMRKIHQPPLICWESCEKVLDSGQNGTRVRFVGSEPTRMARFLGDVSSEGSIFRFRSMVLGVPPPRHFIPEAGSGFTNPPKRVGGPSKIASWPQDGPKMAQDGLKIAPRWPKMAPKWPKTTQDGPRWPKIAL